MANPHSQTNARTRERMLVYDHLQLKIGIPSKTSEKEKNK